MASNKKLTLFGIVISMILFYFVMTGFFGLNKSFGDSYASRLWVSRIEFWIVLLIIFLFAKNIEKQKFLIWKTPKRKILFYITSILILLAVITVFLTSFSLLMQKFGVTSNDKELNTLTNVLCGNFGLLIFTCLTAAFTEELVFRGYLLPRLEILLNNKWMSIFLSSLLFGLAHIGFGDFERMLFPFIIGIIFSIYYYKYKSLTVLIICHFLMDFYSTYGACK